MQCLVHAYSITPYRNYRLHDVIVRVNDVPSEKLTLEKASKIVEDDSKDLTLVSRLFELF